MEQILKKQKGHDQNIKLLFEYIGRLQENQDSPAPKKVKVLWDLKLEERERIDWLKGRDRDLAELYGVETKQLKRQVRRNIDRFPHDFMFELSKEAHEILRSQIATLGHGEHAKYIPMAFGEYYSHGGPKLRRSVTVLPWRHILWTWHN